MNEEIRTKLAKIYALVNNGGTDGEKAAAKKALDRIVEKYNITAEQLESIELKQYVFKYSTHLETRLLAMLLHFFTEDAFSRTHKQLWRGNKRVKEIVSQLNYLDWVTIESAYEYFRRHMGKEFKRVCAPELKRCRKPATRNKRKAELEELFFDSYIIKSELVKKDHITTVENETLSVKELKDRMKLRNVQGGKYTRQLTTGLLLNDKN